MADPADPGWTGEAALELIRAAAERRRPAMLLDLAPESSDLPERFGAAGAEGFAEATGEQGELARVACRDEEGGFAYLPRGLGGSARELAGSAHLVALVERVREADGVVLVLLASGSAREAADAGWPDGWILLGEPRAAAGGEPLPGEPPEYGRIEPRDESGGEEAGRWDRHRKSATFPTLKVAGAAALLAALAGSWWWYAARVTAADGSPDTGGSSPPATRADSGRGRLLEYSVLIASYGSAEDARERVRSLSSRREGPYFVAPTPVRGSLWHRVYAGSFAERAAAVDLMERLVEAGAKDAVRAWDVRPVPWSFRLPESFADRSVAASRVGELHGRGVPAYVLPVAANGGYRIYSGAFESRGAASALGERLKEAGVDAELVRRTER